jgi:hypothetical protein
MAKATIRTPSHTKKSDQRRPSSGGGMQNGMADGGKYMPKFYRKVKGLFAEVAFYF